MAALALEMSGVRKRFGRVVALDGVGLRVGAGRVHGVLGENGAGKSTLMNVAYGLVRADEGRIEVGGREVRFRSPRDAIASGVGMVHQHFMLAGAMTVLDNVLLGDPRAGRILRRREAAERLVGLGERLGLRVEPGRRVEGLSVGEQQRVEILKALWRDVRVLILDEPTAVLTPGETEQLMGAVARLRAEGRGVVFISHKLGEVGRICDEVTVLRRGRVVWEGDARGVSAEELAREMVGREVERVTRGVVMGEVREGVPGEGRREAASGKILRSLKLPQDDVGGEAAGAGGPHPGPPPEYRERGKEGKEGMVVLALDAINAGMLRGVSLSVGAGEIVGVAGVDGNGQQALAEVVVGLRRAEGGRVVWRGGVEIGGMSVEGRARLGIGHVPNDRKREALVPTMSVAENLMLKAYRDAPWARRGVVNWRRAEAVAEGLARAFDVRAASVRTAVGTLSGGNQQKVVLARELAVRAEPLLVVATNPVRGLDVAAANFVYEQLLARRAAGAGVLLISSELDELLALCDRIGVLYAGRLTMTDFPRTGREEIGRLMAGVG